jgi:hypothetical protein
VRIPKLQVFNAEALKVDAFRKAGRQRRFPDTGALSKISPVLLARNSPLPGRSGGRDNVIVIAACGASGVDQPDGTDSIVSNAKTVGTNQAESPTG